MKRGDGQREQRDDFPRPADVDHDTWAQMLAEHYGFEVIDLSEVEFEPSVVSFIPREVAFKYTLIPVAKSKAELVLAMANPVDVFALDDVKFMTGYQVTPAVASKTQIEEYLPLVYPPGQALTEPWVPKESQPEP